MGARRPKSKKLEVAPDGARMAKAIAAFLTAAGADLRDPELAETPERVAAAWIEDFLDGYRSDPAEALGRLHPAESREMIVVAGIDFHSMCPHHLIPYRGVAHVGYLPKDGVVGFGRLVRLVDTFAHRLILQEQIGEEVTRAIVEHLGADGAACILEAEQGCVTMRGPKRRLTRTVTRSFRGAFEKDARLRDAFLQSTKDPRP